jgi:glutaredoxin 3
MPAADVTVYTTAICPYCIRAKTHLKKKGVTFQEVDVSEDQGKRTWLKQVTGQHTVPQIFINGKPIGGCDDMLALDRQGKLDPLLAQPPG